MSAAEPPPEAIRERGPAIASRPSSMTSRLHSVLAIGLMSVLGMALLGWYYTHSAVRSDTRRRAVSHASVPLGDAPLPGLDHFDPPPLAPAANLPAEVEPPTPAPLPELPLVPHSDPSLAQPGPAPSALSPRERELSGAVYASQSSTPGLPAAMAQAGVAAQPGAAGGGSGEGAGARPRLLESQKLLLPKGAFIDCTLETAIDSTLPGMTTCVMATDVFGVDGRVVLLERGTKLVGETRGQVQQGAARVMVIWDEARTPQGVIVPLASPGADELGRSGLPGTVNRHFWQRFGAAMLVSVIDGAAQAAVQSARNGVIVNPSGTEAIGTEALKGTVNIPPTIVKSQGDRIQVLVARDVDFRSVYELVPASPPR